MIYELYLNKAVLKRDDQLSKKKTELSSLPRCGRSQLACWACRYRAGSPQQPPVCGPLFGPSLRRGYVSPNLPCNSDPHFTDRVRRPSGRTWEGKYQDLAISCLVDPILYLNTFRNVSLFI